jgi:cyclopropane fatty-acyl-phospholipid synthase-like methyltransferase
MLRRLYDPMYRVIRFFHVPLSWVFGTHHELAQVLDSRKIGPCRVLDVGCGGGREAVLLARRGFDVTAVDFSPTALGMARANAEAARVAVEFIQDDLTNLTKIRGTFDLVVDYGAFNDLTRTEREGYMRCVPPLTHPGTILLLMCFEKALPGGEVEERFGELFEIEEFGSKMEQSFRRGINFYIMTRR